MGEKRDQRRDHPCNPANGGKAGTHAEPGRTGAAFNCNATAGSHGVWNLHAGAARVQAAETRSGRVEMEPLFKDWAEIVRSLKRTPTVLEYEQYSRYSVSPLRTRFNIWGNVAEGLRQYAQEQEWAAEWADVLEIIATRNDDVAGQEKMSATGLVRSGGHKRMLDRPVYGPPVRRDPLAYGPVNEAGVVFLFGVMAERLGFIVTRMQTEFPDCEAMWEVEEDRWQRVFD